MPVFVVLRDFSLVLCDLETEAHLGRVAAVDFLVELAADLGALEKLYSSELNDTLSKSGVEERPIVTEKDVNRIIYEICDGLKISLKDFFDSPLFDRDKYN